MSFTFALLAISLLANALLVGALLLVRRHLTTALGFIELEEESEGKAEGRIFASQAKTPQLV